jgi:hypothetical protein
MGKYSLSGEAAVRRDSAYIPNRFRLHVTHENKGLTFLTALSTYGFPFSSLYAPTPRLIFLEYLSALKASVTPIHTEF